MDKIIAELAPTGTLRAGINLSNFLLVTGRTPSGDPTGVAPDMAGEIAKRLGVPLKLVPFKSPGELADAVNTNTWDIGLIADEPARAAVIAFAPAYVEIEATYIVRGESPLKTIGDVDRSGIRIVVAGRTAYDLWLTANIKNAELLRTEGGSAAFDQFKSGIGDALAGLRPGLLSDVEKIPGTRLIDGRFTTVQQAIGTARANLAGAAFLRDFVEDAKRSGLVANLIDKHKVRGLSVAS